MPDAPSLSATFRWTSIVVGCAQNVCFGGVLYGWPSISGTLLMARPTEGGPGLSLDYVLLTFVASLFFSTLGPLFLGVVLDMYGPRVCSALSFFIIAVGAIAFALSNLPNLPLFAPAMCLLAFGGHGVQSSIVHLRNLFPGNKAAATAAVTMSFQLSFIVFYAFDQLWFNFGVDYQSLFLGYGLLALFNVVLSLTLWPDEPYEYSAADASRAATAAAVARASATMNLEMSNLVRLPSRMVRMEKMAVVSACYIASAPAQGSDDLEARGGRRSPSQIVAAAAVAVTGSGGGRVTPEPTEKWAGLALQGKAAQVKAGTSRRPSVMAASLHGVSRHGNTSLSPAEVAAMVTPKPPVRDLDMYGQLTSNTFVHLCAFFVVTSFWANFFIGTLDLQLGDSKLLLSAYEQRRFGRYFSIVMTASALAIPVVGHVMDRWGFPTTWTATVGLGMLWSLLLLYDSEWTLLPSFVCYALFRTFLYTFLYAYVADSLGNRYFGVVAGVMFAASGVAGAAIFRWPSGPQARATWRRRRWRASTARAGTGPR